jgi:hypothetical protein
LLPLPNTPPSHFRLKECQRYLPPLRLGGCKHRAVVLGRRFWNRTMRLTCATDESAVVQDRLESQLRMAGEIKSFLRGARLGGQSFEDERGIEFAARQQVGYRCAQGHLFEITMSDEADVPAVWECPRCGAEALSKDGLAREVKVEKPVRTHWDMLLERRSITELEEILTERLELLRGGEIGPAHLHRPVKKTAAKKKAKV